MSEKMNEWVSDGVKSKNVNKKRSKKDNYNY